MRLYFLIFVVLISCMKNKKQENIEKVVVHKQGDIKKPIIDTIENDTTIIRLKEIDFNLLDVRLNNVDKRELIIVKNNSVKHKIKLLTGDDYMGFSINHIKDIGKGFEISIEFGKFYYERNFEFIYQNNSFFLTKIETHSIDYKNNNSKKEDIKIIESPVSIEDFKMEDFIN